MSSIVAIVGRPNVGKSTLFNRLIGKRHAIIAKEAGTTRDRIFHPLELNKKECILVDTGGLDDSEGGSIEDNIQAQAKIGIEEADFILFIIDGSMPLTIDDFKAAEILRKSNKKTLLVINKCDNPEEENIEIGEIYKLGFGEPVKISAIHNLGIDILKYQIEKHVKAEAKPKQSKDLTQICLLGRPNVGKSSLFNALIGQEKVIVSDVPGTTRDAIDTELEYKGEKFNLIDTAGLRRKGKRERGIEKFSAMRSIGAVERCDLACLIIDANEGVKNQDCHVIEYILEKQKGLIIIANKIDLFEKGEEERDKITLQLRRRFSFVPWAPVLFTSAKNKKNITRLFELAAEIKNERSKRIKTSEFNNFTQQAAARHHASTVGKTAPKIYYSSQVAAGPPVFVFLVNDPKNFHFSYVRYLENRIREEYGFTGTPIKLKLKARTRKALADLKKKS